jgi:serine/threonine-protein kinase HipA
MARTSIDTIAVDDLTNEAVSWGMSARRATSIVTSCIKSVQDVVETMALPPGAESVKTNLEAMWVPHAWPT